MSDLLKLNLMYISMFFTSGCKAFRQVQGHRMFGNAGVKQCKDRKWETRVHPYREVHREHPAV